MRKRHKFNHGLPLVSLREINGPSGFVNSHSHGITSRAHGPSWSTEATDQDPTAPAPPWLAQRRDAPACNFSRKAKRPLEADWSAKQRRHALDNLRKDYVANSAKGPAAAVLRTWESMHIRMMGRHVPVFPLTPEKIANVAAAFKACGYRSFNNYMSKAKEVHIHMIGNWGIDLSLEARRSSRSVSRGIGPVAQRSPLDFDRILSHQKGCSIDHIPIVEGGPIGAHNMIVIGTFVMLREIEASLLLLANVKLDRQNLSVTIRLPCSKTDPAAASLGAACVRPILLRDAPTIVLTSKASFFSSFLAIQSQNASFPFSPTGMVALSTR